MPCKPLCIIHDLTLCLYVYTVCTHMHALKLVDLRWHVLHLRLQGTLHLITGQLLQTLHYGVT